MKKDLYFVTSSDYKFKKAEEILGNCFNLYSVLLDLPEHQKIEVKEVAEAKAIDAYRILNASGESKHPVLIDDAGIYLKAYRSFPGALAKFTKAGLGMSGILRLLSGMDRSAESVTTIAYCDETLFQKKSSIAFEARRSGVIADMDLDTPFLPTSGFAHIFIPDGSSVPWIRIPDDRKDLFSERVDALRKFLDWAKRNVL